MNNFLPKLDGFRPVHLGSEAGGPALGAIIVGVQLQGDPVLDGCLVHFVGFTQLIAGSREPVDPSCLHQLVSEDRAAR